MGAPSITYEAPEIPKDDTFEKLMQYQQERQLDLDERAQRAASREEGRERKRRETGALGFDSFLNRISNQVQGGIIPFETASQKVTDYLSDYSLRSGFMPATETRERYVFQDILDEEGKPTGEKERVKEEYEYKIPGATEGFTFDVAAADKKIQDLQDLYYGKDYLSSLNPSSSEIVDGPTGPENQEVLSLDPQDDIQSIISKNRGIRGVQFEANVQKAYQDLFGESATTQQLADAYEGLDTGIYEDGKDFRRQLKESDDYTKKFNDNYLDNYYDTFYGSTVAERTDPETGEVSKLRKYKFDKTLLPGFDKDKLEERTGITLPDYETFFEDPRSIAELEDQRQGIRQTKDFIYKSGLTSLQGQIDQENLNIKIQGEKDIAKINQATAGYNLLGGFSF